MEKPSLGNSPSVYEPAEDSEMLAEIVAREALARGFVLDVGTGSGLQAITAALKPSVKSVVATDVNREALKLAHKNAAANGAGVAKKIRFVESDLFARVRKPHGGFDCVVFNPPYLPASAEEKIPGFIGKAFDGGGARGRRVTERFLKGVKRFLKTGGVVLLVQSSLSGYPKTVRALESKDFDCEIAARRRFFFEEIVVVKAVLKAGMR